MQKRTSPLKFGDLAEKSGFNSVSSIFQRAGAAQLVALRGARGPRLLLHGAREHRRGHGVLRDEDRLQVEQAAADHGRGAGLS